MSSFFLNPTFQFISCNHSTPKSPFFNTPSFSFFKFSPFKKKKKKLKSSSISVSYQQPPSETPKRPINNNPLLGLLPYLIKVGGFLLKSSIEKWGSLFRGFSDSHKESLDFYKNGGGNLVFIQSGGIGMTLLSVTSTAKLRISPYIATLASNPTFVSAMLAWFSAQSMKMVLNFCVERRWDFRLLCASGGMPSSHSALCTALTTSVALCHGVADSLFPVCLGFTLIVMYDAIGVRRHAGMQAEVLNMIIADLFQGHPISQRKLKELLGHTPSQVLAGAILGILVACLCCQGSMVPA